jgi:diguanylate cyclase (GGDEF)-like protein
MSFVKKYSLIMLYICFSLLFILTIYLSVVISPHMRATALPGAFCITPLAFIDRPIRVNLFVIFRFIVHTVLAFLLKPLYVLDDTVNGICFTTPGCYIGNIMIWVRLEGYEAQRLLTIEKETDVVTGLYNRRKLFETLADLEKKNGSAEKPSGVLMIDIDRFKSYNDSFGHAEGDKCLSYLGEVFRTFARDFHVDFYRYGGEEFVAFIYGCSEEKLPKIAEKLRLAVQNADICGHSITVSIGATYCGNEQVRNYEHIIDRADRAVYAAKGAGRNRVCQEKTNEIFEQKDPSFS